MPALVLSRFALIDGIATVILAAVLIRLVIIDLREFRLPDRLTLPLIGLGLGLSAWRLGDWPVQAVVGAALGYAVFWLIGFAYFRWRGVDGLGQGDAKLLAAAGAWLGAAALPWVVLIAASGAVGWVGVTRRDRHLPLAFGPWLAAGFWVMWTLRVLQGYI